MSNGSADPKDPWFNTEDEDFKQWRRDAANEFLEKAMENPDDPRSFRQRVRESEDEALRELNQLYRDHSGREIPPGVRVICLEPNLMDRGKLVLFLLPTIASNDPNAPHIPPDWGEAWIAAWEPY